MPDSGESEEERTRASITSGPAARAIDLGDNVGGSYRIKSILGRGGMGVVYFAAHVLLSGDYALKALVPDKVNEDNWSTFQAEGKAIAKLEHCRIVKIYDMGIDRGEWPFYLMDLLEGPSLAEFIRVNGPLTLDPAVEIFTRICDGLGLQKDEIF